MTQQNPPCLQDGGSEEELAIVQVAAREAVNFDLSRPSREHSRGKTEERCEGNEFSGSGGDGAAPPAADKDDEIAAATLLSSVDSSPCGHSSCGDRETWRDGSVVWSGVNDEQDLGEGASGISRSRRDIFGRYLPPQLSRRLPSARLCLLHSAAAPFNAAAEKWFSMVAGDDKNAAPSRGSLESRGLSNGAGTPTDHVENRAAFNTGANVGEIHPTRTSRDRGESRCGGVESFENRCSDPLERLGKRQAMSTPENARTLAAASFQWLRDTGMLRRRCVGRAKRNVSRKEKTVEKVTSSVSPRFFYTTPLEMPFNNFLKAALWTPDGSAFLTTSEDRHIRLFATPQHTLDAFSSQCRTSFREEAKRWSLHGFENSSNDSAEMSEEVQSGEVFKAGGFGRDSSSSLPLDADPFNTSVSDDSSLAADVDLYGNLVSMMRMKRAEQQKRRFLSPLRSNVPKALGRFTAASQDPKTFFSAETLHVLEKFCRCPFDELKPWAVAAEGESIYDVSWYPRMSWDDPSTCCFVSTSRDHPVHLRSAYNGAIVGSYVPYNHLDEVQHATALAFHPFGNRLYGGSNSCIRIFDIQRPGRQVEDRILSTRRGKTGQKGIVSTIAFKVRGREAFNLFACGTYGCNVALYREGQKPLGNAIKMLDPKTAMGAVTEVAWSKTREDILVSGHRQDVVMRCWDVRMPSSPLFRLERRTTTNQRFSFDISLDDIVVSGDDDGNLLFHDLSTGRLLRRERFSPASVPLTSAAYHPTHTTLLLVSSGTRKFEVFDNIGREARGVDCLGGGVWREGREEWRNAKDEEKNLLDVKGCLTPEAEDAETGPEMRRFRVGACNLSLKKRRKEVGGSSHLWRDEEADGLTGAVGSDDDEASAATTVGDGSQRGEVIGEYWNCGRRHFGEQNGNDSTGLRGGAFSRQQAEKQQPTVPGEEEDVTTNPTGRANHRKRPQRAPPLESWEPTLRLGALKAAQLYEANRAAILALWPGLFCAGE